MARLRSSPCLSREIWRARVIFPAPHGRRAQKQVSLGGASRPARNANGRARDAEVHLSWEPGGRGFSRSLIAPGAFHPIFRVDGADAEVFDLEEFLDAVFRAFACDAAFLHAADGGDLGRDDALVDADDAVFEGLGDAPNAADVAAVEIGGAPLPNPPPRAGGGRVGVALAFFTASSSCLNPVSGAT